MLLLFLYLLQENPSPTWKKEIAAAWLAQKQGDYQQAATAYKEILDTHPDLASSDPDSFFHATAGVGFNTLALGKLEQAESVYRGALALARTREHPSALQLSEGLALVLGRRGAFQEAERLFEEVLETRQDFDQPAALITRNNYAELLIAAGRYDRAEELLARDLQHKVDDLDDALTLAVQHNLALVRHKLGKTAQAERLGRKVWQQRRRILGDHHPDSLTTANNLANSIGNLHGPMQAVAFLRERLLELEDEDAPTKQVLLLRHSLAHHLMNAAMNEQAASLLAQTWRERTALLGPRHPDTLRTRATIAENLLATGNPDKAEPILVEVNAVSKQVLPPGHTELGIYEGLLTKCRRELAHINREK